MGVTSAMDTSGSIRFHGLDILGTLDSLTANRNQNMTSRIAAILCILLTATGFAVKASPLLGSRTAALTNEYIGAKVSLDYPGFEGLSVDSLGKAHFPLVTMRAPPEPRRPVQATQLGSHIEYRRPEASRSAPP